jgi:hypothetical protein
MQVTHLKIKNPASYVLQFYLNLKKKKNAKSITINYLEIRKKS